MVAPADIYSFFCSPLFSCHLSFGAAFLFGTCQWMVAVISREGQRKERNWEERATIHQDEEVANYYHNARIEKAELEHEPQRDARRSSQDVDVGGKGTNVTCCRCHATSACYLSF